MVSFVHNSCVALGDERGHCESAAAARLRDRIVIATVEISIGFNRRPPMRQGTSSALREAVSLTAVSAAVPMISVMPGMATGYEEGGNALPLRHSSQLIVQSPFCSIFSGGPPVLCTSTTSPGTEKS